MSSITIEWMNQIFISTFLLSLQKYFTTWDQFNLKLDRLKQFQKLKLTQPSLKVRLINYFYKELTYDKP